MNKIQCCVCKCGSVIAGCSEPECWEDEEWKEQVKEQLLKGRIVEMKERGTWVLQSCKCSVTPISPSPTMEKRETFICPNCGQVEEYIIKQPKQVTDEEIKGFVNKIFGVIESGLMNATLQNWYYDDSNKLPLIDKLSLKDISTGREEILNLVEQIDDNAIYKILEWMRDLLTKGKEGK